MIAIRTERVADPAASRDELGHIPSADDAELRDRVAEIIATVAREGDMALIRYARELDGWAEAAPGILEVDLRSCREAADGLETDLRASLEKAVDRIRAFHERQLERGFLDVHADGTLLGQRVLPLRRVGIYVPGGRAAYPSSVLMNAVPAAVAGVEEIVMVTPTPGGHLDPTVLAAAHLAGVSRLFRIGGAQAVAALAHGTESVPAVDKIVGPGNRWVAEAKRQLFGRVDIDMIAGPSEILVIADGSADPRRVAADLIGQAEHDPDAIAWLVTPDEGLAAAVPAALEALLADNPRRDVARRALEENGRIVIVPDLAAAAAVADLRAPEHLELLVPDALAFSGRTRNAGAIFLGDATPEPMGDYIAGPSHVLPTGGTARWASPLGVHDFLKRTSLIGYSPARLAEDGDDVIRLAEAEGLHGHAEAVRVRLRSPAGHERHPCSDHD